MRGNEVKPASGNSWESGDRVYRYWDAGIGMEPQPLTVVRINRKTITVRTDQGNQFRMRAQDIVGRWTES